MNSLTISDGSVAFVGNTVLCKTVHGELNAQIVAVGPNGTQAQITYQEPGEPWDGDTIWAPADWLLPKPGRSSSN